MVNNYDDCDRCGSDGHHTNVRGNRLGVQASYSLVSCGLGMSYDLEIV